jgi:predicted nucleic acid-binding protein
MIERLALDCSVAVKWRLAAEPQAAEAGELLLDWQQGAIEVAAPSHLTSEVTSTFLRAYRRGRVTEAEAIDSIRYLLALPFVLHETTAALNVKAFEIATRHNQHAFDCIYVALAEREGIELWTGDQRLYNALHAHCTFVRWIADYRRKRP